MFYCMLHTYLPFNKKEGAFFCLHPMIFLNIQSSWLHIIIHIGRSQFCYPKWNAVNQLCYLQNWAPFINKLPLSITAMHLCTSKTFLLLYPWYNLFWLASIWRFPSGFVNLSNVPSSDRVIVRWVSHTRAVSTVSHLKKIPNLS